MFNIEKVVSHIDAMHCEIERKRTIMQSFITKLINYGFKYDDNLEFYDVEPSINNMISKESIKKILRYKFIGLCVTNTRVYLGYYKNDNHIYFDKWFTIDDNDNENDITDALLTFITEIANKVYMGE